MIRPFFMPVVSVIFRFQWVRFGGWFSLVFWIISYNFEDCKMLVAHLKI
jgi:hypothetical protein